MVKAKCKVFWKDSNELEDEVNMWLLEKPNIDVISVTQTYSPAVGRITLTIFYYEHSDDVRHVIDHETEMKVMGLQLAANPITNN